MPFLDIGFITFEVRDGSFMDSKWSWWKRVLSKTKCGVFQNDLAACLLEGTGGFYYREWVYRNVEEIKKKKKASFTKIFINNST